MRAAFVSSVRCVPVAIAVAAVCGVAVPAAAAEEGTVLSSTPVYGQVAVPQQQCTDTAEAIAPSPSGVGALLGAVVGGLAGHGIGAGVGRAAATGIGAVAGAAIGNQVEANGTPAQAATVRRCQTVIGYQQQVIGYDVVYDHAGVRYTTRLAHDPGPRIALNVTPAALEPVLVTPALPPSAPPVVMAVPAPVMVQPAVVIGGQWGPGWRRW